MEKFIVNGRINSRYIEEKEFSSHKSAEKYVDSLCTKYDLQVEEIISENNSNLFLVDYHNEFSIKQINFYF